MTWAAVVRRAYVAARGWGIQPSEFWAMSPEEWWLELDGHIETQARIEAQTPGLGGRTKAEWEEAKRRHREKMRDRAGRP